MGDDRRYPRPVLHRGTQSGRDAGAGRPGRRWNVELLAIGDRANRPAAQVPPAAPAHRRVVDHDLIGIGDLAQRLAEMPRLPARLGPERPRNDFDAGLSGGDSVLCGLLELRVVPPPPPQLGVLRSQRGDHRVPLNDRRLSAPSRPQLTALRHNRHSQYRNGVKPPRRGPGAD